MSTLPKTFVTPEEYLELERKAEFKSEYHNGEVFAMSGGSRKHSKIAWKLTSILDRQLQGKSCEGFTSDIRVLVASSGLYTYPDLSVACEQPRFADAQVDTLLNPTLIVEILSPSTERYDRGEKAKLYRDMPSLKELLLVAQDAFDVELYRRQGEAHWDLFHAVGLDASIELKSIGCTLTLREIYENVLSES